MRQTYRVGDIWDRGGKLRRIRRIEDHYSERFLPQVEKGGHEYTVFYENFYGSSRRNFKCWCATWEEWARKATLIKQGDGSVEDS